MTQTRYLQRMGVPVWRLRNRGVTTPAPATEAVPAGAETRSVTPAEPPAAVPRLRVSLAHGAPGQQLVDELLQAAALMGKTLEVEYRPDAEPGIWLGDMCWPSVGRLLAEPTLKAELWHALRAWLDEQGGTGGA